MKPKPAAEYMIVAPVFVTGWDDRARIFQVEYQPIALAEPDDSAVHETTVAEKRYGLQILKVRLHQAHFRKIVLAAYRNRCSVSDLRVRPLLDGAHILPDMHPQGEPIIQNGLAMCALHHRAFDRHILRVDTDYTIAIDTAEISQRDTAAADVLLRFSGRRILLPKDEVLWPDRERLRQSLAG